MFILRLSSSTISPTNNRSFRTANVASAVSNRNCSTTLRGFKFLLLNFSRGCMHGRVFIKKTWLSAFSYAQSRISLVFCCSLGFLVPWFSPLQLNKIWRIFCVMYGEEGGWNLIVCLQKLYLTNMLEWLLCYIQF